MNSILQDRKEDYFFRKMWGQEVAVHLQKHHIFGGPLRSISEANGFWVWLIDFNHTGANSNTPLGFKGVHHDRERDLELKRDCQAKYEETHSREEFMALIGRNYLEEMR